MKLVTPSIISSLLGTGVLVTTNDVLSSLNDGTGIKLSLVCTISLPLENKYDKVDGLICSVMKRLDRDG